MRALARRLLGFVSLRWKDPSTCEACGGAFTCGATITGCWCVGIQLDDATRARLRSRYKKCLCRVCLERAAAGG